MSEKPVNIYSAIVFDLNKRIKEFIDELNNIGQIDLDDNGYPYVLKVEKHGPNFVCHVVRNGQEENFIINTRKKRDPEISWDGNDGFQRAGGKRVVMINKPDEVPKRERQKRPMESFERITNQILRD